MSRHGHVTVTFFFEFARRSKKMADTFLPHPRRALRKCLPAALALAMCVCAPQHNADALGAVRSCIAPSDNKKRMPHSLPRFDDQCLVAARVGTWRSSFMQGARTNARGVGMPSDGHDGACLRSVFACGSLLTSAGHSEQFSDCEAGANRWHGRR